MKCIETPKISEILFKEFMESLGISTNRLAKDIHAPVSKIQDILHDRHGVSADACLRLGIYFGVSERYFLNLQNDIDLRNTTDTLVSNHIGITSLVNEQKT